MGGAQAPAYERAVALPVAWAGRVVRREGVMHGLTIERKVFESAVHPELCQLPARRLRGCYGELQEEGSFLRAAASERLLPLRGVARQRVPFAAPSWRHNRGSADAATQRTAAAATTATLVRSMTGASTTSEKGECRCHGAPTFVL